VESPVRGKRCWNAAMEEEEERTEKGERETGRRGRAEDERRGNEKEGLELLPTLSLSLSLSLFSPSFLRGSHI